MKRPFLLLAFLLGLVCASQAQNVTLKIDAGQLRGALGTAAEPVGGLLQIVASPSGVFSAPNTGSYVSGDNVLVTSFAMNNNGGTAETFNTLTALPLISQMYTLTAGESLLLRFYPSLTLAGMPAAPTLGTTYGQVRSDTIEFGTAGGVPAETAWFVPAAGSTVNFEYVTVSNGGTYANANAFANGVVLAVPEPSVVMLLGMGILFAGVFILRRRRAA